MSKLYGKPLDDNGTIEFRGSVALEVQRRAIARAASEITDLWWARPDENGHVKTRVVEEIIQKHLWGEAFTDVARKARIKTPAATITPQETKLHEH